MSARLSVQSNGFIVVTTRTPGRIHTTGARNLRFRIEWLSNCGWQQLGGDISDDREARAAIWEQRRRNPSIRWRLTAFNDMGRVSCPRNWMGGYS